MAGRPKKKLDDLPKDWTNIVIRLYKQGASDVEIRAALDISIDLFYRLLDDEKEFSETIKKGRQVSQTWWERQGRTNLKNREFSAVLWFMNMRNRFGWRNEPKETDNEEMKAVSIQFVPVSNKEIAAYKDELKEKIPQLRDD